ncbi:MAG: hypothetical protein L0229_18340 [Blastocatellia bacterium]|nr:hypothetical protein [Blastocatellia bacterium]
MDHNENQRVDTKQLPCRIVCIVAGKSTYRLLSEIDGAVMHQNDRIPVYLGTEWIESDSRSGQVVDTLYATALVISPNGGQNGETYRLGFGQFDGFADKKPI